MSAIGADAKELPRQKGGPQAGLLPAGQGAIWGWVPAGVQ